MESLEILIAGLVQGFTEFLPVSSSGHLVYIHWIFGFKEPTMVFDVYLHLSTLFAVLIFFRRDLMDIFRKRQWHLLGILAAASVPAVIAGLLFQKKLEVFFSDPVRVSAMLIVTGGGLLAAHLFREKRNDGFSRPGLPKAMVIGLAQAFALLPGISRSGATISAGVICGMKAEEAFRFSFLLSVPVVAGAAIYHLFRGGTGEHMAAQLFRYLPGMVLSFICGLASLFILRKAVVHSKLHYFGFYCVAAGTAGFLLIK